jgi:hypothetical protein
VTQDELQVAVLAFLDQFIGRGAADDVRDLRTRLVTDPATQARLADELPSSDASEREAYDAMRRFFAAEYERGQNTRAGGTGPGLIQVLSWTGWGDWADNKTTNDPAQWHDWIGSVRRAASP